MSTLKHSALAYGSGLTSGNLNSPLGQLDAAIAAIFFDVSDYGAVGDGATNDTVAIQAAINAANTAGGGIVQLAAKTYSVSTLTVKSKVTLQGRGKAHYSQYSTAEQTVLTLRTGTNASLLYIDHLDVGIVIRDLTLQGNSANQTGTSHGIELRSGVLGDVHSHASFSAIEREQAIGRVNRAGQAGRLVVVDFICEDSVDESVMEALEQKRDVADWVRERLRAGDFQL
jgi:hypothetical protein